MHIEVLPFSTRPWQRVHIDYAEYQRKYFFVAVDAHSKWPEIFAATKTTTQKTISILRHLFSSYGFPEEIVSDNGPQFTSDQFADFLRQNGVRHTRSAPYHPATNGAAERMVQVLKKGLTLASRLSVDHQLANLLLSYRSTPHSTTGVPPAELFLKRQLRTRLTLLKPDQESCCSPETDAAEAAARPELQADADISARRSRCCSSVPGIREMGSRYCSSSPGSSGVHGERQQQNHPCTC